jgi:Protein of unknown function (DUF2628)
MKTYTLHLPPDAQAGDREAFDRAVLVKDGFSWGAFFFTFLWFFYHRLWLAGLGVMAGLFALGFLFRALEVTPSSATLAQILVHILIGLEAGSLRLWTLARRGQPALDVVTGDDSDEAAAKAFNRWLGTPAPVQRPSGRAGALPVAPPTPYGGPPPVIGLFPDAEGRR